MLAKFITPLYLLGCFFLFAQFSLLENNEELPALKRSYDKIDREFSACDGKECLKDYYGQLKKLTTRVVKGEGLLVKYLHLLVRKDMAAIQLKMGKEFQGNRLNNAKAIRKELQTFRDVEDVCYKMKDLEPRNLRLMQVDVDNCTPLIQDVDTAIIILDQIELNIFEQETENKSISELRNYIRKSSTYPKLQENSNYALQAIKELYTLVTLDGNARSINAFYEIGDNEKSEFEKNLIQELENLEEVAGHLDEANDNQELLAAKKVGEELNSQDEGLLRAVIEQSAPNGLAFEALKRLIAHHLFDGNCGAITEELSRWKKRFCLEGKLYEEIRSDFLNYEDAVMEYCKSEKSDVSMLLPKKEMQDFGDQIRYIYSNQHNYLAVLSHSNNSAPKIFEQENDDWKFLRTDGIDYQPNIYTYQFQPFPYGKENPEDQIVAYDKEGGLLKQSDGFKSWMHSDVHFYSGQNGSSENLIAFFVSSAPAERLEFQKDDKVEFNSPWEVYKDLKFQERGNKEFFNGKISGNANTDIYYSFYKKSSATWTVAKHLGNVVNTRFSERSPFVSGYKLYFSSEGHGSLGGYDVYSVDLKFNWKDKEITLERKAVIEPVLAVNSVFDDLYYTVNEEMEYVSSNRNDNKFILYKVEKSAKAPSVEVKKQIVREGDRRGAQVIIRTEEPARKERRIPLTIYKSEINSATRDIDYNITGDVIQNEIIIPEGKSSAEFEIIPKDDGKNEGEERVSFRVGSNEEIELVKILDPVEAAVIADPLPKYPKLEVECMPLVPPPPGKEGMIQIALTTKLYQNGVYTAMKGGEATGFIEYENGDREELKPAPIRINDNGKAYFFVPQAARLELYITRSVNGELKNMEYVFDDLCKLKADNTPFRRKIEVVVSDFKDIQTFNIPFFFNYNDDSVENSVNNLKSIKNAMEALIKTFNKYNSSTDFIVVAYADSTGKSGYNCNLSKRRAERVRKKLIEWDLPSDKISSYGFGETTKYDYQLKDLQESQLNFVFPQNLDIPKSEKDPDKRKQLQLNRRAEILFCHGTYSGECLKLKSLPVKSCTE